MKLIYSLCLAAALLSACSKKEADPQPTPVAPAPVQAATINLAFDYYAAGSSPAETQSMSFVAAKPVGQALADRLEVKFEALSSINTVSDQVQFVIPLSRQKVGLKGTYTLASQPDTGMGEVLVTFTRPGTNSSYSNVYGSNNARLEGSFVITDYDATRRLISGTYSVKALDVKGPFSFLGVGSAGDPRRSGDLRLTGTFQEVPLK